jgi:hypothetical protein
MSPSEKTIRNRFGSFRSATRAAGDRQARSRDSCSGLTPGDGVLARPFNLAEHGPQAAGGPPGGGCVIVECMASGEEHDPGRRASTELALYGVEGWPGQRQIGSSSGISRTGRGGGKAVLMLVGVNHSHGDASITITSHRQQDNGLASLRRWVSQNAIWAALGEHSDYESSQLAVTREVERLQSAARLDELPWESVTIPVDGQPTPFQLCEVQYRWWVAVGRGADADLTLESRRVPLAGLALVRVTDLPVPELRLHLERPKTPARQFPAAADPVGVIIPGHSRVDLTFERSRLLSGSVGGQPVRVDLNVPTHDGAAAGTFAGIPVAATWENGDNYRIYPDVPSDLNGSFAGRSVELRAIFHLEPDYFFDRGTITGHIGAEDLHATAERASGGLGGRTVAVDGTLGGTEFTIYATIDGPLTSGQIRGTVAGTPIRIDAARTRQPDAEKTRLTGSYQGPPALLALAAGALLHFI